MSLLQNQKVFIIVVWYTTACYTLSGLLFNLFPVWGIMVFNNLYVVFYKRFFFLR